MTAHRKKVLSMIACGLATLFLATTSAIAASSQKSVVSSSSTTMESVGSVSEPASATDRSERKPGPAWRTIGGTVKHIKGDVYTVEDYEGNQVQLYVSRETKHLRGNKKVGDRVRVEITHSGFANSIQ